jgi:predicted alpha-1,2-mannosidase
MNRNSTGCARPPSSLAHVVTLAMALATGACTDGPTEPQPVIDPLAHVDTSIGTAGGGFGQPQTFVGAAVPFGMVRPGPDTAGELPRDITGFAHTSGYWYLDMFIEGFSQLHLSGTGIEDFGNVLVMPTFGMTSEKTNEDGYRQRFRHATETTEAGLYAVTLDDTGIRAELTTAAHAAVHRYTFPEEQPSAPVVIVDVSHGIGRPGALDADVTIALADGLVEGSMLSAGRFTGTDGAFPVYFSLAFDPAPERVGVFDGNTLYDDETARDGAEIGAYLTFAEGTERVTVRVGMSFIDLPQARTNRATVDDRPFEHVHEDAVRAWRAELARIKVVDDGSGTADDYTVFYTGLYHSLLFPTGISEPGEAGTGARYMGIDRLVHDDEGVPQFTDFSMWDTYRTAHPLYALLVPDQASAFATSILRMADEHGSLPRWPLAVNETGTMLGTPASIIFADTYLRGARDFDVERALAWMKDDALSTAGRTTRVTHALCVETGHCPSETVGRSVASAIEWGAADFALAQLCRALDDDACASLYAERATLVRGHFDPSVGFFRARAEDGTFPSSTEFDATAFTDEYAEGNAWQYLYAAPYDTHGLVELLGGADAFIEKTRTLFDLSEATPPRYVVDEVRAMDPYYWHGNEPDLHAAFMFSLAGAPDEAARAVSWIRTSKYSARPEGLDGNDDAGTLSSWIVLAALGIFPLPGSDVWILTAPFFDDVTIERASGPLTITAERESASSIYIRSIAFDDVPHDDTVVTHDVLARTSRIDFVLSDAPAGFAQGRLWEPAR